MFFFKRLHGLQARDETGKGAKLDGKKTTLDAIAVVQVREITNISSTLGLCRVVS